MAETSLLDRIETATRALLAEHGAGWLADMLEHAQAGERPLPDPASVHVDECGPDAGDSSLTILLGRTGPPSFRTPPESHPGRKGLA